MLDFLDPNFAKATKHLESFVSQSNEFDVFDPDVVAQRLRGTGMLSVENFTHLDLSRNTLIDHEFSRMLEQQVWVLSEMPVNRETNALTFVSKLKSLNLQVCVILEFCRVAGIGVMCVSRAWRYVLTSLEPKLSFSYLFPIPQECEIGNHTLRVISVLMQRNFFPNLEELHLGTNIMDQQGIDYLLEPLRRQCLPNLKRLYIPLNNIYGPGMQPGECACTCIYFRVLYAISSVCSPAFPSWPLLPAPFTFNPPHLGLLLISAAQTLGVFDTLVELDLSDIGCATDTIALFAKAIVDRFKAGKCCLKK